MPRLTDLLEQAGGKPDTKKVLSKPKNYGSNFNKIKANEEEIRRNKKKLRKKPSSYSDDWLHH